MANDALTVTIQAKTDEFVKGLLQIKTRAGEVAAQAADPQTELADVREAAKAVAQAVGSLPERCGERLCHFLRARTFVFASFTFLTSSSVFA